MKTKLRKLSTKKTSPENIDDSRSGPVVEKSEHPCLQLTTYLVQKKATAGTFRSSSTCSPDVTKRSETTNKPMSLFEKVTETKAPLRTFDNLFVYFKCVGQESEIQIQEATKNQDKGTVILTYYRPTERGNDDVDGRRAIVSLSNNNFFLYVDKVQKSVQLKEIKKPSLEDISSEGLLFHLTNDYSNTECRFECRETPGMWIGVKENQLTVTETEHRSTFFKINKY